MNTKLIKLLSLASATFAASCSFSLAGAKSLAEPKPAPTVESLFGKAWEISLAASYRDVSEADFGVGFGVTRFVGETLGFGVSAGYVGDESVWEYSGSFDVYLRSAIKNKPLAPYVLVGAGLYSDEDFSETENFYRAGLGLDYRIYNGVSVFAQGVRQFSDDEDTNLVTAGIRLVF